MTKIAILYGGQTGEHDVSRRSAASVVANLDPKKYEIVLIGISPEGAWFLQHDVAYEGSEPARMVALRSDARYRVSALPGGGLQVGREALEIDIVFPVLHGTFGEDGTIQGLLETAHLPYVGAGVLGSAIGMDKIAAKKMWERSGLNVVPFVECTPSQIKDGSEAIRRQGQRAQAQFGMPLFVKPVCAGSSVGVSRVDRLDDLEGAVRLAARYDRRVMIERCITGREVECSVLGNDEPIAFLPGEIVPRNGFYDYEAKYVDEDGAELVIPAELAHAQLEEIRRIAVEAFRAIHAEGMARVDFLIEQPSGAVLLNEINTIPGFTNISMYARMCEVGGLSYPDLLDRLIDLGMERFRANGEIEYTFDHMRERAEARSPQSAPSPKG